MSSIGILLLGARYTPYENCTTTRVRYTTIPASLKTLIPNTTYGNVDMFRIRRYERVTVKIRGIARIIR